MREVIQGVMDVLRMSGVNRDAQSVEEGEAFKLPEQTEETREDTAYAAEQGRDTNRSDGRKSEEATGKRARRAEASRTDGRARGQTANLAADEQRAATARLMRGVNQLATTPLEEATRGVEDLVMVSEDALSRTGELESEGQADAQLGRSAMTREQSSDTPSDGADERMLREVMSRGEANRLVGEEDGNPERTVREQMSVQTARVSTAALEQRATTDPAAAADISLGQQELGDEELVEEAAAEAFDEAQAIRNGDGVSKSVNAGGQTTVVQTGTEFISAPPPTPAPDPASLDSLGESTTTDTMMEEIMMAQRSAAGGDRVGDSDAVIRLSESAAGALEVKMKREGKDLSVRVRAEDLAMRHVMVDSLPELKHELQKANLVEGQIEVTEDGIEDQMESEYTWDGEHSTQRDEAGESNESANLSQEVADSGDTSKTTGSARHDGQLHVVA